MTTLMMPMCGMCTHLHLSEDGHTALIPWRCDAFPDGIPADILRSQFDHRAAHEGDHGIMFDPRDQTTALAYVNVLFPRAAAADDAEEDGGGGENRAP